MKTLLRLGLACAAGLTFGLGAVQAQPAAGTPGMGMGPGMAGRGAGPGGGWRMSRTNTPGYTLMTQEERIAHQTRMRSMQSYDECVAYVGEHHAQMAIRAQEKGITLPAPRGPCDAMKVRGRLN